MQCSSEDAVALFLKPWIDNGTELVVCVDGGNLGSELCKVDWISPGNLSLISILFTRSGEKRIFGIRDVLQFSYEDLRAERASELVERGWTRFLLMEFAEGRSLLFAEPKLD